MAIAGYHDSRAVWTGSELLVWGGLPQTSGPTGATWNPGTDQFTPIPDEDEPLARKNHTLIWTGTEMVVWGGSSAGGRYRPYADADGDGFDWTVDCADADSSVHPGAVERCDGRDNQCPGDAGHGLVDELDGPITFTSRVRMEWPEMPGATSYRIARSPDPGFGSCTQTATGEAFVTVSASPPPGSVDYLLVHVASPYPGSWGRGEGDAERDGDCLP